MSDPFVRIPVAARSGTGTGGGAMSNDRAWRRQSVRMAARPPHADWHASARVSPSGRWAVTKGKPCGWRVSHVPTGLACVHLECLLRDVQAWCERVDAEIGPVLDDATEEAKLVRDVPARFGLPVRVNGRLVCESQGVK